MQRSVAFRALVLALLIAAALGVRSLVSAKDTVTRAAWIDGMRTAIPDGFCKEGGYFRSCFAMTREECESIVSSATRVCLSNFDGEIPAALHQPADGQSWGQKVGECAGNAFEVTHAAQKVQSPKCNDPSAWM